MFCQSKALTLACIGVKGQSHSRCGSLLILQRLLLSQKVPTSVGNKQNGSFHVCHSSLGKTRRPMGKLVYNLLSMPELKRRLKECHLSLQGSRDQLIKRHQTFVHIYNAECDSLNPKSGNPQTSLFFLLSLVFFLKTTTF